MGKRWIIQLGRHHWRSGGRLPRFIRPGLPVRGRAPSSAHRRSRVTLRRSRGATPNMDKCSVPSRVARRNVLPVERMLNDRRAAFVRPSAHPRGALRRGGFVNENDQLSFGNTLFLIACQVLRFQVSTASSLRLMAGAPAFAS